MNKNKPLVFKGWIFWAKLSHLIFINSFMGNWIIFIPNYTINWKKYWAEVGLGVFCVVCDVYNSHLQKILRKNNNYFDILKKSNSDITGMSDTRSVHQSNYRGWLYKWTNYLRGYQKRWFVLQNGLLSYYRLGSNENIFSLKDAWSVNLRQQLMTTDTSYTCTFKPTQNGI